MKKTPRLIALISCVSLVISLIFASVPSASALSLVNMDVVGSYDYDLAYEVLSIANEERVSRGLKPLHMDTDLLESAMQRAAETSVSFSHTRPNGEICFTACTWEKSVGENIAGGYETPADAMAAWRGSDGHYANITSSRFTCVGVGVFINNRGVIYWSQIFDASKEYEDPMYTGKDEITATVSVDASLVHLSSTLSDSIIDGKKGEYSSQLNVLHTDPVFPVNVDVSPACLNFSTSDEGVASIDENGVINAYSNGAVDITASLKDNPSISTTTTLTVINTVANVVLPAQMILGDADNDEYITIVDATLIQQWLSLTVIDEQINLLAADVDRDGDVTILDSTIIQKHCANIVSIY